MTWRTTLLCFLMAVFAWGALFYGNGFYLAALSERHGWSTSLVSTGITLSFLACIPSSMAVGWAIDRHGMGWGSLGVVTYGALGLSTGIALMAVLDAPWQLYLTYLLLGSAYPALAAPAISATLNQRVKRRYGLALSFALTGASVGGMLSAPVLVWSAARFGFEAALLTLSAMILAGILPVAMWVLWPQPQPRVVTGSEQPQPSPNPPNSPGPVAEGLVAKSVRSRAFRKIITAAYLSLVAQVGFLAHQLSVLTESMRASEAALLISATALASVVGRFLVGALSNYLPISRLAALTYIVQGAGIVTVALADSTAVLFAGCVVAGLFVGAVVMLPPMLCRESFETIVYGRLYGFIAIGAYLGGGSGPFVAALIRDYTGDYLPALLSLSVVSVLAAFVVAGTSTRTRA